MQILNNIQIKSNDGEVTIKPSETQTETKIQVSLPDKSGQLITKNDVARIHSETVPISSVINITHNLDTENILVNVWSDGVGLFELIQPSSIYIFDSNNISISIPDYIFSGELENCQIKVVVFG